LRRPKRISALLDGPHNSSYGFAQLLPIRFLGEKLLLPSGREPVILELAGCSFAHLPFRDNPSPSLKAVESWVKRAMLDPENIVCGALNVSSDLMTMCLTYEQSSHNEHVQSTLKQVNAIRRILRHDDGRNPTISISSEGRVSTDESYRLAILIARLFPVAVGQAPFPDTP
jgi:hypothetical protein